MIQLGDAVDALRRDGAELELQLLLQRARAALRAAPRPFPRPSPRPVPWPPTRVVASPASRRVVPWLAPWCGWPTSRSRASRKELRVARAGDRQKIAENEQEAPRVGCRRGRRPATERCEPLADQRLAIPRAPSLPKRGERQADHQAGDAGGDLFVGLARDVVEDEREARHEGLDARARRSAGGRSPRRRFAAWSSRTPSDAAPPARWAPAPRSRLAPRCGPCSGAGDTACAGPAVLWCSKSR
jgi:hypothetical protein